MALDLISSKSVVVSNDSTTAPSRTVVTVVTVLFAARQLQFLLPPKSCCDCFNNNDSADKSSIGPGYDQVPCPIFPFFRWILYSAGIIPRSDPISSIKHQVSSIKYQVKYQKSRLVPLEGSSELRSENQCRERGTLSTEQLLCCRVRCSRPNKSARNVSDLDSADLRSLLLPPEDQEKRTPGTPSMTSGRRKRRLGEVKRFCNNSIAKESMFTLMETGIKYQLGTTELISILSLGLEVEGPGSVGKQSWGSPHIMTEANKKTYKRGHVSIRWTLILLIRNSRNNGIMKNGNGNVGFINGDEKSWVS